MSKSFVLGVDGGASKTVALVSDHAGRVLGAGRAGNCDLYSNGPGALDEIESAVRQALAAAGIAPTQASYALFSLCGADWPEDFDTFRAGIAARGLAERFEVVNDAVGALGATVPEGDGVIVVCGTGAATGSRNAQGQIWHTSFWQNTQGGAEIAGRALKAVYRAELGIDPPTLLTQKLLHATGCASAEALLHRSTARIGAVSLDLNAIPPLVFDAAEEGDAAARTVVLSHGESLGDHAVAAARKVGIAGKPFDLVLSGGLLRHPSPLFARAIIARTLQGAPGACPRISMSPPVKGAVLMALSASHVPLSPEIDANLEASLPASPFFSTAPGGMA